MMIDTENTYVIYRIVSSHHSAAAAGSLLSHNEGKPCRWARVMLIKTQFPDYNIKIPNVRKPFSNAILQYWIKAYLFLTIFVARNIFKYPYWFQLDTFYFYFDKKDIEIKVLEMPARFIIGIMEIW